MLVSALITSFTADGAGLDVDRWLRLAAFQRSEGVDVLLVGGTTGEGASLTDPERARLLDAALAVAPAESVMLGLGSGRVGEVIARGRAALRRGVRDLMLVDCPYVGAASAALRDAWYGPIAEALPESRLYAYAVPGRTGTALAPEDLALLAERHACVVGVKDATGTLTSKRRIRELCGDRLVILSGDDHLLAEGLAAPDVRVDGAVSFGANLAPRLYAEIVAGCGSHPDPLAIDALAHVAALVTVEADEDVTVGGRTHLVPQRYRNPVPMKAALAELGVDVGPCRAPLAPMGPSGRRTLVEAVERLVEHPARPLAELGPLRRAASAPSPQPS